MPEPTIYVASAGTGKTYTLIQKLKEIIEAGDSPRSIMFTTFTNAGAQEIIKRVMAEFPDLKEADFPYFRTLHSIAYRNIPYKQMIRPKDYFQLARMTGYPIKGRAVSASDGTFNSGVLKGDILLQLNSLQRSLCCTAADVAPFQTISNFSPKVIEVFGEDYRNFKEEYDIYDFTDQLEQFSKAIAKGTSRMGLKHIFVDEAQDLSTLQWQIIHQLKLAYNAELYIAGDDKQSLYAFTGAEPTNLIEQEGKRIVLETSYRVPDGLMEYSEGIASRISIKQPYSVSSKREGGNLERIKSIESLPLDQGSWFFLVRNRFMMDLVEENILKQGYLFESDNQFSCCSPKKLDAIRTWTELIRGFDIAGDRLKQLSEFLPTKKVIRYGFMKLWHNLHEDEYFDLATLKANYGLLTELPWHKVLNISQSEKEILMAVEEKQPLSEKPRIKVSTIHGVKGQEAENVVVFPDISQQTERSLSINPDSEHRVFYVAVTRAKENLYLHEPMTNKFYPL